MKTETEIIEKLKIYQEIKNDSAIFTPEFTLPVGAIAAIKWILDIE